MNGDDRPATREQRIVRCLEGMLPREESGLKDLRARALDLPSMLRRHGLMHVLLFLASKQGSDGELAGFLYQGIFAALSEDAGNLTMVEYAERLAAMELPLYLLHWEAAQQSATWLKLLVEARTKSARSVAGAASAAPAPDSGNGR
jgi:hypothetical protein